MREEKFPELMSFEKSKELLGEWPDPSLEGFM